MLNFNQAQIDYLNGVESHIGDKIRVWIQNVTPASTGNNPLYIKNTYRTNKTALLDITDKVLALSVKKELDPDSPYGNDIHLAYISTCQITLDDTEKELKTDQYAFFLKRADDYFIPMKFGVVIEYNDGVNPAVPYFTGILVRDPVRNDKEWSYTLEFQDYSLLFKNITTDNISYIGNLEPSPTVIGRVGADPVAPVIGGDVVTPDISGYAVYSHNGTTWTANTSMPSRTWTGLAYGNGQWAACGSGGILGYSTDGITWRCYILGSINFNKVRFVNGQFAFCGADGTISYTYGEGSGFNVTTIGLGDVKDIAYNSSLYLYNAIFGTTVYYFSPGGGVAPTGTSGLFNVIKSHSSGFIVAGGNGEVYYSTNGNNYTRNAKISDASILNFVDMLVQSKDEGLYISSDAYVRARYTIAPTASRIDFGFSGITSIADWGGYDCCVAGGIKIATSTNDIDWTSRGNFANGNITALCNNGSGMLIALCSSPVSIPGSGSTTPGIITPGQPGIVAVISEAAIPGDGSHTYYYINQQRTCLTGYIQERFIYEAARHYRISATYSDVTDVRGVSLILGDDRGLPAEEYFMDENLHYMFRLDITSQILPLENTILDAHPGMVLGFTHRINFPFKARFYVQTKLKAVEFARHIFRIVFSKTLDIQGSKIKVHENFWDEGSNAAYLSEFTSEFSKLMIAGFHQDYLIFEGFVDNRQGNFWRVLQEKICCSAMFLIHFDGAGNFKIKERQLLDINDQNANGIPIQINPEHVMDLTTDFSYKYYNKVQTKSVKYQAVKGVFNAFSNGHIHIATYADPNVVELGSSMEKYLGGTTVFIPLSTYTLFWIDGHRAQDYKGTDNGIGYGKLTDSAPDGSSHEAYSSYGLKNILQADSGARPFYTQVSSQDGISKDNYPSYYIFDTQYGDKGVGLIFRISSTGTPIQIPDGMTVSYHHVPGITNPIEDGDYVYIRCYGYPLRKNPILITLSYDGTGTEGDGADTTINHSNIFQLQQKFGFSSLTIHTPYTLPFLRAIGGHDMIFNRTDQNIIKIYGNKKKRFNLSEMIMPFFEPGDVTVMAGGTEADKRVCIESETLEMSNSIISTGHSVVEWK